jgi:chemotaxis protein methyltransferase CheR
MLTRLSDLARERIGLKPALTAPRIAGLLENIAECDRAEWVNRVERSGSGDPAWKAFTEALLVHETYFFRHPAQIKFLAEEVLPEVLAECIRAGRRKLRIWCAGCASGEEVYTIALILEAAISRTPHGALSSWDALVLGTDLSEQMVEFAGRGRYTLSAGLNSFRDIPDFARHHFEPVLDGGETTWTASGELKRCTRFLRQNLVSDPAPFQDADLILCRNTLIYFDEANTKLALTRMKAALRPSGVLMLGSADTLRDTAGFTAITEEQVLFWRKLPAEATTAAAQTSGHV